MKKYVGLVSILICLSLGIMKGQTNVSGGIYSNTTWTLAGSPYIVTDTVVVFPGVTLTIQPGVVVKFDSNMELEIRQATLIARGTATDSITFTSNSITPAMNDWYAIVLNGPATPFSTFNYCNIKYSYWGIFEEPIGLPDTLRIKNTAFYDNNIGLYAYDNRIIVDSSVFLYNSDGLSEAAGGSLITHCNFFYNSWGADLYRTSSRAYFDSCNFEYNSNVGLGAMSFCKISNCIVKNNLIGLQDGAYPTGEGYNIIENCVIDSNLSYGFLINGDGSGNDSIIFCNIKYNGTGISDSTAPNHSSSNYIISNNIEDNTIGIKLYYSDEVVTCNTICNNAYYNIYYSGIYNTNVHDNYWHLPDSTAIQPTIFDGYQDINYGLVFFTPFDTVPCVLPCNLSVTAIATYSIVCSGDSTTLSATITDHNPIYTAVWNPGNHTGTTYNVTPLANTTYTLVVTDSSGCKDSAYVTIDTMYCSTSSYSCSLTINTSATNTVVCIGDTTTLFVSIFDSNTVHTAVWNPGSFTGNTFHVTPISNTTYTVVVTDSSGCTATSTITIHTTTCSPCSGLYPPSICYVTTDTSSTFNTVVWQKTGMDTLAIDSVIIYRMNVVSQYVPITEQSVHAWSTYNDYSARPLVEPSFYKLGIHDTCGSDTTLSNFNETVFLQSVSTGPGTANLIWNLYQGSPVNYYRILRDDSGTGNWHAIDSVNGFVNAYTDRSAPVNPGLRYLLSIDWNVVCTPSVIKPRHGSHYVFSSSGEYSNVTKIFPTGIQNLVDNNSITISPNPSTGIFQLVVSGQSSVVSSQWSVEVYNVLGEKVYSSLISQHSSLIVDLRSKPDGVYFYRVLSEIGGMTGEGKMVIQK